MRHPVHLGETTPLAVTFTGTVYHGGAEIGRAHQVLFDSFLKGTRLNVEIIETRTYGNDVAVVVTRGGRRKKLATYTIVRESDGAWRIAAVQKTQRKPLMEAVSFGFQPASRPR
ncbi:SgcJ/EcaC family oxidoreductase [Nonomuraea sp. NPDC059007]|uniref:SgcJ/EcaC family oxidoreductase n=1 Tax=Nonomuraea sp. NPDC059007 TaxID=3346692 RepID=UPI0036783018